MKSHRLPSPVSGAGFSRRTFLRQAARWTAGAFVLPQIVPASALGRSERTAPSNRIVMGCIGVGGQGTQHVVGGIWTPSGGLVGREDAQVVAVCDVNRNRRENARNLVNERYGNKDCRVYNDFRELLARPDIDAVLIATGDRWHPLISIAAAKAGKDVYCEKPISLTIEEALAMREAVRRYGIVFQMGTQQRSSSSFRFACELVRNGYIGEVKEVLVGVGGPATFRECRLPGQPVPDWLDYDMWLGPAPWRPYHPDYVGGWMAFRDFSGGEMTNWGAHGIDQIQWALGADDTGPVELEPLSPGPNGQVAMRYASGVPVRFVLEPGRGPMGGAVFVCEQGKLEINRNKFVSNPREIALELAKQVDVAEEERKWSDELALWQARWHMQDWLDAIRSRRRPVADVEIGHRSVTVCHLANIVRALGRPLRWDAAGEQFVGDAEANDHVRRPRREGFELPG
jgi:predicted dehydrogenase